MEPQFDDRTGSQYVNTGPGPQLANNAFNGPVYFNHTPTRNEVLKMLYRSQYEDRKNRNTRRVPGTCDWFVSHRSFVEWREAASSAMLWVSADPGCGKSVLAKYLVDEVLLPTDDTAVCYFFFKDDFDDQKTLCGALCCLLRQLFLQRPHLLSKDVTDRFLAGGSAITNSPSGLWRALLEAAEAPDSGEIICVLDALDECEEQDQTGLYQVLVNIYSKQGVGTLKFLLTSRPYAEIHQGFKLLLDPRLPVIHLSGESPEEVEKISEEIDLVIHARVEDVRLRLDLTTGERDLLLKRLMDTSNRTYLWVSLVLDSASNLLDIDEDGIRRITSELPRSVDEAYDKILCRSPDPEAARKLLHIIVGAYEPLTLSDVSTAFFIDEHHKSFSDITKMSDERFERFLRHVCGLLVSFSHNRVYLLHQTVKEFLVWNESCQKLLKNPRLNWLKKPSGKSRDLQWKHSLQSSDSHWVLANACAWCLIIQSANPDHAQLIDEFPFIIYTDTYWYMHACNLPIESQELMTPSLLQACWTMGFDTNHPCNSATTFISACHYGMQRVVRHMLSLDDGTLVHVQNINGQSPLSCAARIGHYKIITILLDHADRLGQRQELLNSTDCLGKDPLAHAVGKGNVTVVRELLEAGASLEATTVDGATALHLAAWENNTGIIQLFRDFGADLEARAAKLPGTAWLRERQGGYTPLHYAAEFGHLEAVQLLLGLGAQRNVWNDRGKSPVDLAIASGHSEVAALLMEP